MNDWHETFPPISAREWKQRIQYELQGKDYNEALVWESPEGIRVKPFYTAEDVNADWRAPARASAGWKIAESLPGYGTLSVESALRALHDGADALYITVSDKSKLPETWWQEAGLKNIPCYFSFAKLPDSLPASLREGRPAFLNLDPIGHLARTGTWHTNRRDDFEQLRMLLSANPFPEHVRVLGVNGTVYQHAGANMVQQLAYCLSHACEYLHHLGHQLQRAPVFLLATGGNYFFEIAKFRAMRLLWATLAGEFGLPQSCHIVAFPSIRNKTICDYNNNMLRATSECMAAIAGMADTLVNLPYDFLFKAPNAFSARMARNQLLILRHEAHMDAVENPADGAYYIEVLTRQLADKALNLFKQLEAGGGFIRQLETHAIQRKVKEAAAREQQLFNQNSQKLVGINVHPNREETRLREVTPFPQADKKGKRTLIEPLLPVRLAEGLETQMLKDE